MGGGERLADHDLLLQRIREHDLPEDAFRWYLDLRKFGSFPHAGFGMGIERVVTWICGIDHLRETIAFPRMLFTADLSLGDESLRPFLCYYPPLNPPLASRE